MRIAHKTCLEELVAIGGVALAAVPVLGEVALGVAALDARAAVLLVVVVDPLGIHHRCVVLVAVRVV